MNRLYLALPTLVCDASNVLFLPYAWSIPKKGNLQQWQNYPTISLISHPSKAMLKTMLNRLKPQAEKIIAEEQAGFNLRFLCEKYLQHQQDLYHVFIDFKKAIDSVWHAALWQP